MTTAEEMALAVLKGDEAAAMALANLLCERRAEGGILLPPINKIDVPLDKLRLILFIDPRLGGDVEVDEDRLRESIAKWKSGEQGDLILVGFSRVEVYQLP